MLFINSLDRDQIPSGQPPKRGRVFFCLPLCWKSSTEETLAVSRPSSLHMPLPVPYCSGPLRGEASSPIRGWDSSPAQTVNMASGGSLDYGYPHGLLW